MTHHLADDSVMPPRTYPVRREPLAPTPHGGEALALSLLHSVLFLRGGGVADWPNLYFPGAIDDMTTSFPSAAASCSFRDRAISCLLLFQHGGAPLLCGLSHALHVVCGLWCCLLCPVLCV